MVGREIIPKTPRKTPPREIAPQTPDRNLQGDDDANTQPVTPKMNSGVVVGKAVISNRNADGQSQGSEPSSSTLMFHAPYSL